MKLLGLLDTDNAYLTSEQKATKSDGELAALGTRLMLEFEPLRESADREARLMEGHMRIAYSVPKHRHYLRGGAPSEPVLAEAAARIMSDMPMLLATLANYLKNDLISKGERGELVTRLLLTLAHDKCVQFDHKKAHEAQYSKPIPLFRFLEALVGPDHMKRILVSKPDNMDNGATFEEAFKDAKVNFTHFVKGGDATVITDKAAWMALSRCMAFQCANGQWMIDLYIPILLWDEKLSRYVVSGIFIQIKNRLKKQPVEIDATQFNFFSDPPAAHPDFTRYYKRPYITIIMDLGVQPGSPNGLPTNNEPTENEPSTPIPEASARIPPKSNAQPTTPSHLDIYAAPVGVQQSGQDKKADKSTHPRYVITIVGFSNAVFQVIGKEDQDKYAALITSSDIIDQHPRQGDTFVRAILRLKPYWTKSAQSFHWAMTDEDKKAGGGARESFVEGVYIGSRPGYENDPKATKDHDSMDVDEQMAT